MSMMRTNALLLVSGLILWTACSGGKQVKDNDPENSSASVSLDSDFVLAFNQAAELESENLTVKFIKVAEDSRCPVGVECIWPGQAKIDLQIKRQDEKPEYIQLTSHAGEPNLAIQSIGDYTIKLVKVEPVRTLEAEMWQSVYKITLKISRNTETGQ